MDLCTCIALMKAYNKSLDGDFVLGVYATKHAVDRARARGVDMEQVRKLGNSKQAKAGKHPLYAAPRYSSKMAAWSPCTGKWTATRN